MAFVLSEFLSGVSAEFLGGLLLVLALAVCRTLKPVSDLQLGSKNKPTAMSTGKQDCFCKHGSYRALKKDSLIQIKALEKIASDIEKTCRMTSVSSMAGG